jgi:hypothetical protein
MVVAGCGEGEMWHLGQGLQQGAGRKPPPPPQAPGHPPFPASAVVADAGVAEMAEVEGRVVEVVVGARRRDARPPVCVRVCVHRVGATPRVSHRALASHRIKPNDPGYPPRPRHFSRCGAKRDTGKEMWHRGQGHLTSALATTFPWMSPTARSPLVLVLLPLLPAPPSRQEHGPPHAAQGRVGRWVAAWYSCARERLRSATSSSSSAAHTSGGGVQVESMSSISIVGVWWCGGLGVVGEGGPRGPRESLPPGKSPRG